MAKRTCVMHLHLWLETEKGVLFGPGRAELLDLVERFGSLRKAAEELGMSYRAAWGKIKRTEEVLGFKLIDKAGSYKGGYRLTDSGRAMRKNFTHWCREVEEYALKGARDIFTCEVISKEEGEAKVKVGMEK